MSEKIYDQEDFNNILAKKTAKLQEKFDSLVANEYVSKSDFAKLQNENRDLRNQIILPKIKSACKSAGLKQECESDFLQLNKSLLECKEEDLQYNIEKCRKERPYMFDNSFSAETGNQPKSKSEKTGNMIEGFNSTIITRTE